MEPYFFGSDVQRCGNESGLANESKQKGHRRIKVGLEPLEEGEGLYQLLKMCERGVIY